MRVAESRAYLRALTDTWAHLRALAKSHVDPGDILTHLNRLLTNDKYDGFMSMFFCRVDPAARTLTYASAGHPGYLIAASGETTVLAPTGVALGAIQEAAIITAPVVQVSEGDLVLLPTDGVFETTNPVHAMFGLERTLATVREKRDDCSAEIVQALYTAARDFADRSRQHDDITAVVIKATG
jgi:sigma-B regulation protein RsbU (phosphoserine phosphatase)